MTDGISYSIQKRGHSFRLIICARAANKTAFRAIPGIDASLWDPETERFFPNRQMEDGRSTEELNTLLQRIGRAVISLRNRLKIEGKFSLPELKAALYPESGDERSGGQDDDSPLVRHDIGSYLQEKSRLRHWESNTRKQAEDAFALLLEYSPAISYPSIDTAFLQGFCQWMENEKGHAGTSIQKRLSCVKAFLRWASVLGRPVPSVFSSFTYYSITDDNPVIFLEPKELARVYRFTVPPVGSTLKCPGRYGETQIVKIEYERTRESLETVRDLFLFCCFTGMRYSDMQNLKKTDVHRDEGLISFVTIKGKKQIYLDLNRYAVEILDRHAGSPGDYALPRLSMQKFNARIGDLMKMCRIASPVFFVRFRKGRKESGQEPKYCFITSHTGRKTFVCNSIAAGIPLDVIVQWTGHAGPKEIRPYVGVSVSMKQQYIMEFGEGIGL